MVLDLPELCLVVVIGPSEEHRRRFARRHLGVESPVSPRSARRRLSRGFAAVVEGAPEASEEELAELARLARQHHVPPVLVALESPGVRARVGGRRGFAAVHHLAEAHLEVVEVRRLRSPVDRREDSGPFDLIGDVHGCFQELTELLRALGYRVERPGEGFRVTPPPGRRALFLGDLVDRGPDSATVLRLAMDMVEAGAALCIPGNHEARLLRWLNGKSPALTHGLALTVEQLGEETEVFRARCREFLAGLPSHLVLDGGRLVAAHAGLLPELQGRDSRRVEAFALYGQPTGEVDEAGYPVRADWAAGYRGRAAVVHGHTPVPGAEWRGKVLCIDTGCVFGGALTALSWPERELVSVPALRAWSPREGFGDPGPAPG